MRLWKVVGPGALCGVEEGLERVVERGMSSGVGGGLGAAVGLGAPHGVEEGEVAVLGRGIAREERRGLTCLFWGDVQWVWGGGIENASGCLGGVLWSGFLGRTHWEQEEWCGEGCTENKSMYLGFFPESFLMRALAGEGHSKRERVLLSREILQRGEGWSFPFWTGDKLWLL